MDELYKPVDEEIEDRLGDQEALPFVRYSMVNLHNTGSVDFETT